MCARGLNDKRSRNGSSGKGRQDLKTGLSQNEDWASARQTDSGGEQVSGASSGAGPTVPRAGAARGSLRLHHQDLRFAVTGHKVYASSFPTSQTYCSGAQLILSYYSLKMNCLAALILIHKARRHGHILSSFQSSSLYCQAFHSFEFLSSQECRAPSRPCSWRTRFTARASAAPTGAVLSSVHRVS